MLSANTIINNFGTWQLALQHHKLSSPKRFSKETSLDSLYIAFLHNEGVLTTAIYSRWRKEHHKHPSLTTIITIFGSWKVALAELNKYIKNKP